MRSSVEQSPVAPGPSSRRVLVVSADMGAGHNATAAVLERQIERRWPGSPITRVDTLDVMGSAVGPVFRRIYVGNVEHTPWLYEFFYASLWRYRWFADASKRFTGTWAGRRLAPIISAVEPDFIVSTYPLGSSGLAWLRRHRGLAVPTGAWVSDFAPHPFWVYGDLDLTVVMHEVSADTARAAEPTAHILVDPLPLPLPDPELSEEGEQFTVLVACGSYSFGDVVATIGDVLSATPDVRVVAVCGRNAELQRRLRALGRPPDRLLILGWTDDLAGLMAGADLLITNGGGVTALEAIAAGTPVVMYRPIAAHGVANADLMVVGGVADVVNDREHLADYIRAMAGRTSARDAMSAARPAPSGPDGLQRLAELRSEPMAYSDAYFVHLDSAAVRQELGVVLELEPRPDGLPDPGRVEAQLTRWLRDLPPLRGRIVRSRRPRLVVDADTITGTRLVRLPAGGGGDRLLAAVTAFWAEPLQTDVSLIRAGLAQEVESGRSLLAVKLHHSVADGLAGLAMLGGLFDAEPDPDVPPRASSAGRHSRHGRRRRSALRTIGGVAALAARGFAPRQPLTRRPVTAERLLVTWDAPREELKSAARRLAVRPHVLALTLVAEALSRLLVPAGLVRSGRPLRVMVPTTLRERTRSEPLDGHVPPRVGNATGTVVLDLPMGTMPVRDRLAMIAHGADRSVRRGEPEAAYAVLGLVGRLPGRLPAAFIRNCYHRRFFHAIVTYLPGPRDARRLAGAPVRAAYPILPLAPTVPLTVGLLTFGGTAGVGVQLAASLGLQPDAVRRALDEAWASLSAED